MEILRHKNSPSAAPSREPRDWIQRRYRVPDAVAQAIAEMVFAAGVAVTSGGADVQRR